MDSHYHEVELQKLKTENEKLEATAAELARRNVALRVFLLRLTDPEDLGWAVSADVRKLALDHAATSN